VPEADPDLTRQKQDIPLRSEDIPGLLRIPPGCAFHPRCPFFEPGTCDTVIPPLDVPAGFNQQAACIPLLRDGDVTLYAGG
jgi:peptide/nickel transport system ATP-binding protein